MSDNADLMKYDFNRGVGGSMKIKFPPGISVDVSGDPPEGFISADAIQRAKIARLKLAMFFDNAEKLDWPEMEELVAKLEAMKDSPPGQADEPK